MNRMEPYVHIERFSLASTDKVDRRCSRLVILPPVITMTALNHLNLIDPVSPPLYGLPDAPFPKVSGPIAFLLQRFGHRDGAAKASGSGVNRKRLRKPAGHKSTTTGGAKRTSGIGRPEQSPFPGQLVDRRGLCVGMTITTKIALAEIIG